jgi:hypothetical protein
LRIAAELFGFPADVSGSKHLSSLAPLDVQVSLDASRQGEASQAAIELRGNAGGSDVAVVARALGDPAKPAAATVDIDGSVTGERPHAVLVLLFPDLPVEQLAATGRSRGKLTVKLAGVPNSKVTGKAALETEAVGVAFSGQGSLQPSGLFFTGKGAMVSQDAGAALVLTGFEAPPSAAGVPLQLRFDLAKQGSVVDLKAISGSIAGETVEGSARFDLGGGKPHFALSASAGNVSLASLLGVLVAWQRTPSTEEMLGAIGAGASEFWPSRGFSLGPIETADGEIRLAANTLALGSTVKVQDAMLVASVGKDGLSITELKGSLFGGAFAASGILSPRGNGAELAADAELKGGRLEQLAKSVAGTGLAKGPFDLSFTVQGEGLSPPGLVAGLSGEGTLALGGGALQSLSSAPLRRVAATAANKTISADKEEIAAEARAVRETITKGTYQYAPVKFIFDVKNGTLRFAPAVLAGQGVETKVNAYLELASLKLDSEWAVSLAGANQDVPPVNLVFTGILNKANEISPSVDTAAIEAYLTMRRMQEDVERLETLDMSGRTPAGVEADQEQTSAVPAQPSEPEMDFPAAEMLQEPEPGPPAAEAVPLDVPQPAPVAMPSAMELIEEEEAKETAIAEEKARAEEAERAAALPPAPSGFSTTEPPPPESSSEPAERPEAATAPAAVEVAPAPRPAKRRKQPTVQKRREAPDDWRKGIGVLGGG